MARQEAALQQWLLDHPDYQLAESLVDAGVSAGKGKHRLKGALARFIQGGREGTVPPGSCLVVESWSRFSREVATDAFEVLLRDVWGQGLAISFCTDGAVLTRQLINDEPHRLHALLGAMQQARAEYEERSRRSAGAAAKRRQRQEQGERPPGFTPFWIQRDERGQLVRDGMGQLVADPEAAAVIRRAVQLAIDGLGVNRIARALEAEGYKKPPQLRGTNQRWDAHVVKRMFIPAITGTLRRRDQIIEGYYPSVVDAATYQKLKVALESRDRLSSSTRGHSKCRNLFERMSRCSECGASVGWRNTSATRKGHPGYVSCRTAARQPQICSAKRSIRVDDFEAACLAKLRSDVWRDRLLQADDQSEKAALAATAQQLQSDLIDTSTKLERARERAELAFIDGSSDAVLNVAAGAMAKLEQQLDSIQARLQDAERQLAILEAQPDPEELARELARRVAAFSLSMDQASVDERLQFNRWLLSRRPSIQFVLHPGQRLQMVVGGEPGDITPIDGPWARIQLSLGGEAWVSDIPDPDHPGYEAFMEWAAEPIAEPEDY